MISVGPMHSRARAISSRRASDDAVEAAEGEAARGGAVVEAWLGHGRAPGDDGAHRPRGPDDARHALLAKPVLKAEHDAVGGQRSQGGLRSGLHVARLRGQHDHVEGPRRHLPRDVGRHRPRGPVAPQLETASVDRIGDGAFDE